MRILPDTIERCCASNFPPEASEEDELDARSSYQIVHEVNCEREGGPRLPEVVYRSSTDEEDIRHHVFRIDLRDYPNVFQNGLRAWPQGNTPDETYYNLVDHVNNGAAPLSEQNDRAPHCFVSTTIGSTLGTRYRSRVGTVVYRYEIYAPGGIFVGPTLGARYNFRTQREVAFVAGIAPQYIRAVQLFTVTCQDAQGYAVVERSDPAEPSIILNMNFRLPQPDPERPLTIVRPACYYLNREGQIAPLRTVIYHGGAYPRREKREGPADSYNPTAIERWYISEVTNCKSYVDAAYRSSRTNEAYVFMRNEYISLN